MYFVSKISKIYWALLNGRKIPFLTWHCWHLHFYLSDWEKMQKSWHCLHPQTRVTFATSTFCLCVCVCGSVDLSYRGHFTERARLPSACPSGHPALHETWRPAPLPYWYTLWWHSHGKRHEARMCISGLIAISAHAYLDRTIQGHWIWWGSF